jgi:hypothetical protein
MASTGFLGGSGLNPFGGATTSFDAFNIAANAGEQAYLIFRKKEILWEQGKLGNTEYLAALSNYAAALPAGSERTNAEARYKDTKYRVERNALIADIDDGKKTWYDLLHFDQAKLNAVTAKDSAEYDQRLANVREVQQRIYSEQEEVIVERYNDGKITAAQLSNWYDRQLGSEMTDNNPELDKDITKRKAELGDAILAEKDAKMVNDFNDGKVGYDQFMAYANGAKGRYAKGTTQYQEWSDRLSDAKDQSIEQSLTYRYGLSQQYDKLAQFVKDHGTAPKGHTTTSTSKGSKGTPRVVWTGSGWKTVYSGGHAGGTKTTYHGPSAAEVKAWKELQVEVKDAKKQMAEIAAKIEASPGGWVSTADMTRYYKKIQSKYVKGTADWYNVQERLDSLNQQQHAEDVLKKQGVKISYPKVKSEAKEYGSGGDGVFAAPTSADGGSAPAASKPATGGKATATAKSEPAGKKQGDRDLTLDEFMRAIAKVESGGRYDAVNKNSGAKGKYQIMPGNWAGWAKKYLGDSKAAWTPENQEKVARGKFNDLYRWLGDWRAVAHWWLTGGSNESIHQNPNKWSTSSRRYVNKVFAKLGMSPTQVNAGAVRKSSGAAAGPAPSGGGGTSTPSTTTGTRTTTKAPSTGGGGGGTTTNLRSPFTIPKGLDGRQFERFYDRFLEAYQNGEESFTDFSTGKAISYWIPDDLELRSELIGYLDNVRIGAYAERARAYAGTASEEVAMTSYSDAIKKAGENQIIILDTVAKVDKHWVVGAPRESPAAGGPEGAAKKINPLAAGLKLKEYTEAALAMYATNAKDAFERGDDEMAYSLIQLALDLAAKNEATLQTYYGSAKAQIKDLQKQTGTQIPAMVTADMNELLDSLDMDLSDGAVSPGYAKALQGLEETSAELEKVIKFDSNDEPIRIGGATEDDDRFVYKDGISLFLTPDGRVEHKQTKVSGYSDPNTQLRDAGQYVPVTVKIGGSVKQVLAKWEPGIVGYIEGTGNPVYGKIITGQIDGKEYVWVENPFAAGRWIRNSSSKALVIKAPPGFEPYKTDKGLPTYQFKMDNETFRMEFDDQDGTYHVFQGPGMFGTDWKDLGSTSSSTFADLAGALASVGWKVDNSSLVGEDGKFFDSEGAWIGFDAKTRDSVIKNTQSPSQALKVTPQVNKYTGFTTGQIPLPKNQTGAKAEGGADSYVKPPMPTPYNDGTTAAEHTKGAAFGGTPVPPVKKKLATSPFAKKPVTQPFAKTPAKKTTTKPALKTQPFAKKKKKATKKVYSHAPVKKLPKLTPVSQKPGVKMHEATGTNTYSGGR